MSWSRPNLGPEDKENEVHRSRGVTSDGCFCSGPKPLTRTVSHVLPPFLWQPSARPPTTRTPDLVLEPRRSDADRDTGLGPPKASVYRVVGAALPSFP